MSQFMLETIMVIFLSMGAGYLMTQIIVPEFTTMWQIPYGMEDLNGVNLVVTLLMLVFVAAILAGMYPAFFGTKFDAGIVHTPSIFTTRPRQGFA